MESFLANLKDQVQCSLCNETLIEPKLLQCFHTFCKSCIKRHAQHTEQVNIFKCPQCTSQTLLQELNDVEDLQTSPIHSRILQVLSFVENQRICSVSSSHSQAIWHCLDCGRSLCKECLANHSEFIKNHQVLSLTDLKKEDIEIMLKRESPCKTHDNQDVDLYCQHCNMLICVFCLKDHHNHKTTSLQEFIAVEKELLSKNLEEIDKMSIDEKEKKQQEIALLIKHDGEKAKEQVKKLTKKLIGALIDNEQELLNEVQKSITKADKNLRIIHHTTDAQEYIKYFIEYGTATEMIDTRDGECSKNFTYNPFEKCISGIEFKPNEELCEQVKTGLGLVRSSFKKADPNMSSIKVEPSDMEATKKAKLTVELRTSEGDLVVDETMENVTIQFTPEHDVKVGEIQMTEYSEITVDFVPRVPGQLTADIQVHGNSVSNSPLIMDVNRQQMKEMTGYSKLKDALNTVSNSFEGIAVNKSNSKIAVADCESNCARVFNMEGDLLLIYGSQGSGQGQLDYPFGLAFLNEIDLVIVDKNNHRICIVNTSKGKLVRTFGSKGNGNGQFNDPQGVHVDGDSNIIVCDASNNRVQVLTKDGDYKYQFSVPYPYSTVTRNGLFYVSDHGDSVVHVIEMQDNQSPTTVTTIYLDYIGTDGQLQHCWGLAIDNDNNLLVCDYDSRLIHKFTLDGRDVGHSSQLDNYPNYITVLNDGQVICTTFGGCVAFF